MPASYQVNVYHGATPTASAWPAGGRFHWADTTPTSDASTTPITVPAAGSAYSWRKHVKLNVTVAPTGSVSNLRFFADGTAWGTGITLLGGKSATYTQGSTADQTAAVAGLVNAVTSYTSAAPLVVNSGTVLTATTGVGTQDYVVLQVQGDTTVSPGTTTARTLTYRCDET